MGLRSGLPDPAPGPEPAPLPDAIPAPGRAPLPASDAAAMLRICGTDPERSGRPAVAFEGATWTHAELFRESCRWANLLLARRPRDRPFHVGVLLDNTPDYLLALAGAALAGATVVGVNHTHRGAHLVADVAHTDAALLVTEPRHQHLLEPVLGRLPIGEDDILVSTRFPGPGDPPSRLGIDLCAELEAASDEDPEVVPGPDALWALIFTSGTSAAPKAVRCSQRRILVSGVRMAVTLGLRSDDVGYVCMPLFHANSLMVAWASSLVVGASVGLARRFSASRWIEDVRTYGATYTNCVGNPLSHLLATPESPDDRDNPLRVVYSSEGSPAIVEAFSRRFDVRVLDAFGATEGAIATLRTDGQPAGSVGLASPGIRIVDPDGRPLPPASFDADGRLLDPEACVGEIVNVDGVGPFEGYYANEEANARATRNGWYWSGDLGYLDRDGYLYFAGRTSDWIRVGGENFPARPVEEALARHPDVVAAAVYGVPDAQAGDQVMAALVLRGGGHELPEGFAAWVDAQLDIGPTWRPRYLRVAASLPSTPTNKVLKRVLVRQKYRRDLAGDDGLYVRGRGEPSYRPFGDADESALRRAMADAGRERFWDL